MVDGVYRMLEKLRSGKPVYSIFQDSGRFLVDSVYRILEKPESRQLPR